MCMCVHAHKHMWLCAYVICVHAYKRASQVAQWVKNLPANAGAKGSIPGLGRPPGEGHGNPLQYACLEYSGYRVAWRAIVHEVAKSLRRLSD